MKCPICNGKGTQFIADYDGMYDIVCDKCKGKGELDENGKPILTNEEYLKSCTTEELAEYLWRSKKSYWSPYLDDTDKMEIEDMLWWLKQPHTIKE